MANYEHQPRMAPTPGCSFVALAALDMGTRKFAPGEPFPFAELGMTELQAWEFWRAAVVEVAPVKAVAAVKPPAARPLVAKPQQPNPLLTPRR